MERITRFKLPFFGALFVLGITVLGSPVRAAENDYSVSLFCSPEEVTADISGSFIQTPGTVVAIVCEMTDSLKDRTVSAFLLGKQTFEGASISTLGNDVVLAGNVNTGVTLPFPAVFQSGEYQYVFSLIDKETQKVLAQESYLIGTIKGDTPRVKIASVTVGEGRHEWQGSFDLSVNFDIPEDYNFQTNPISLHMGMQDIQGNECAVLLQKQFIRTKEQKFGLLFPEEGDCINSVTVSLHDKNNAVVDKKILAVGLPDKLPVKEELSPTTEAGPLKNVPLAIQVGLVITVILILILGGYFFLRQPKRRF